MMFLCDFWNSESIFDPTPTSENNMERVEIKNAIFDDLYIDKNMNRKPTTEIPQQWNYDTIMYAKFKGNLLAGNVDFPLSAISAIVIKQRKKGAYFWTAIHKIPIFKEEDLTFYYNDILVSSKTSYEYAAVPIINGVEGTYQTIEVDVEFDGAFLIDPTGGYQILLNFVKNTLNRSVPSNIITTVNGKYPYVFYNSNSQYDTLSVSGTFIEFHRESCEWDAENGWKYRKILRDWLTNRKSKVFKMYDGQTWMVDIVDTISETEDGHPYNVITNINMTEIGDTESNRDLFYHGFTEYLEVKV